MQRTTVLRFEGVSTWAGCKIRAGGLIYVNVARRRFRKGAEINLIEWLGAGVNCRFVVRFSSFLVGIATTRFPIGVIYAVPALDPRALTAYDLYEAGGKSVCTCRLFFE